MKRRAARRPRAAAIEPAALRPRRPRWNGDFHWQERQRACLLALLEFAPPPDAPTEQIGQTVLALLRRALIGPDAAELRIVLRDQAFATPGFREPTWRQRAPVAGSGQPIGFIEAGYSASPRPEDGRSLGEQQRLLDAAAGRLAAILEPRQASDVMQRLVQAVEDNLMMAVVCDANGVIEHVNAGFTRFTGYTPEDVVGKNANMLNSGEHPAEFEAELWVTLNAGQEWRGEFINRKKNGEVFWERATISPVRSADGRVTHFLKIAEDVTDKKRMEDALKVSRAFLEITNRQTDLQYMLDEFVQQIGLVTLCKAVGIRLLDREGRLFKTASRGFGPRFGAADDCSVGQREDCVCAYVARGRTSLALPALTPAGSFHANRLDDALTAVVQGDAPACCELRDGPPIQSLLITPIRTRGRTLGLMYLADPRPNMISATRVELFEELGLLLGTAVERAEILDALQTSEVTARALLDATTDAALLLEADGTIIALNERQAELWRQPKGQLIGANVFALLPASLAQTRRTELAAVVRSGRRLELGELEMGGRIYDAHLGPILDRDGAVVRAAIYTRDITEIKRTETELRRAHSRLSTVLELSRELASTIDLPSLLVLILERLAAVVPFDRAAVLTFSGDGLTVEASSGYEDSARLREVCIELDEAPAIREMLQTKSPVYAADVADPGLAHGAAVADLPPVLIGADTRSWLAAPLLARDGVIGIICLGHHQAHRYEADQIQIAQSFAHGAAIAISNAHLYQQAQSRATAEERTRLAHELHDSVTQALFSANLIATALPATYARDQVEASETLEKLLRLIRGALAQMRTLLMELVPEGLMEERLSVLLGHLRNAMAAEIGAPVDLIIDGECDLRVEERLALYRIAQEALYNISKHAEAGRVAICLTCDERGAALRIHDDGKGFEPAAVPASHLGVRIMGSRAASIGARLDVDSAAGRGTQITVTLDRSERMAGSGRA